MRGNGYGLRRLKFIFGTLVGWKCLYCGCKVSLYPKKFGGRLAHIDHIIPKSKGGSNCLSNLTLSCDKCNIKKSNKIIKESTRLEEYWRWCYCSSCIEYRKIHSIGSLDLQDWFIIPQIDKSLHIETGVRK